MSSGELKNDGEFVFHNMALEGSTQSKELVLADCSEVLGVVDEVVASVGKGDSVAETLLERMKILFPVHKE